ncbi:FAD/NAD(P)-binding domain-containing protein [Didymella exigua CBS 183.55]|uniref:FAD/NAD(P)-binding domain-containing protein n=1 Tax=Didymella exigua CBS 183.55 TaxID=1150837 RepID=A0A6A5RUG7_9PLEO|nr:FAD/NAD(P)-binding domain-containing protein [Didymella exigua CBS 183.55]KAF1931020.1 FAD/NAD(P)-binding domain-containing protein [Didymella exigua CBS 183.55]
MRIIIVGGGIAGMSTYLHLRKHLPSHSEHDITIYESHRPRSIVSSSRSQAHPNQSVNLNALSESTAIVGGGLGISPNGMRVLRDLSLGLHDRVVAQGFPAEHFIFKGANGWSLGMQSTSDKAVRAKDDAEEVCIASSRHGLWTTLRQYIVEEYGEEAIKHKKVLKLVRRLDLPTLRLQVYMLDEQGRKQVDNADLVIGADGVKSVVRNALFGDDEKFQPIYSGQSGVGGFHNTTIPPIIADNRAMVFEFGGSGFFGYSSGGPISEKQLMWWSTFETSTLHNIKAVDPRDIRHALSERHKHWKDPIIEDIVSNADVESIYPTWIMPELPHWGKRGVVLIGDAAHALDPTTGQGASQALEDSQVFSLLLAELLDRECYGQAPDRFTIDKAIKVFYEIRHPRVKTISDRGKKLAGRKANVGIVKEYFMYCFIWLLIKFPSIGKALLSDVNRELYCWSSKESIREALRNDRIDDGINEQSRLIG